MNEEKRQDNDLVAFTDELLEGQAGPEPTAGISSRPQEEIERAAAGRPMLADTVETLARVLAPQPPPDRLRQQSRRRVIAEWSPPPLPLYQRLIRSFRHPRRRWAWAMVAALVVMTAVTVLLLPIDNSGITGTAAGEAGVAVWVALLALAGILVIIWRISRK